MTGVFTAASATSITNAGYIRKRPQSSHSVMQHPPDSVFTETMQPVRENDVFDVALLPQHPDFPINRGAGYGALTLPTFPPELHGREGAIQGIYDLANGFLARTVSMSGHIQCLSHARKRRRIPPFCIRRRVCFRSRCGSSALLRLRQA